MYTVPQLKQAASLLALSGITQQEARERVASLAKENPAAIADILKSGHSGKKNRSTKNFQNEKKQESAEHPATDHGEILETVQGELITDNELPQTMTQDILSWLSDFSQQFDIDLKKASGQQWRSACMFIGQHIQASGLLLDHKRMRVEGGKRYHPNKVEQLMFIWEYLTGLYKHVPLACDFVAFSGVSSQWFYDSDRAGLTSSQMDITKKMREIEERALSVALNDSKENPTGRIYYTKARLGWRESVEIVHTSAASVGTLDDIPKLTDFNN